MLNSLILAISLLSTTACAHILEGKWTTNCNQFGRHALISTVEFEQNVYRAFGSFYARPGCGIKTVNAKFEGSFEVGQSYGAGIEFNYIPQQLTLTLLKHEVVAHYNKNKICNFDDWALNIPRDILGQPNCVGFVPPDKNIELFDIFNFKAEESLKFASFPLGKNITNPSQRPLKIDPQVVSLWKVSKKNKFKRVKRDLKTYDDHIAQRRMEFAKIPKDINDKSWVKKKLAFMVEIEQYMRRYLDTPHNTKYSKNETEYFSSEFSPRFEAMDKPNTADLRMLLNKYEWFTISEFGKIADGNAWLLVQHADLDTEFQKHVLEILGKLRKVGETSLSNYAYLFDRVASASNDPLKRMLQRYGTQGYCVGPGKWVPHEIEEPMNVDIRRKEVGLGSLQEYIDGFKDICK
mgnify:CR=1 FL=1